MDLASRVFGVEPQSGPLLNGEGTTVDGLLRKAETRSTASGRDGRTDVRTERCVVRKVYG